MCNLALRLALSIWLSLVAVVAAELRKVFLVAVVELVGIEQEHPLGYLFQQITL
jgi:hypothetical protein